MRWLRRNLLRIIAILVLVFTYVRRAGTEDLV